MSIILDDRFVSDLIKEEKYLPNNYKEKLKLKKKSYRKHQEWEIELSGAKNNFTIVMRKNLIDPFDFSIILRYEDVTGISYNIVRYNGNHKHINRLEGSSFRGFHIHKATRRYQENGFKIETYAELTEIYGTFEECWNCFQRDLNIKVPRPPNTSDLFEYGGE